MIIISGITYGNACSTNTDKYDGCLTILACAGGQCKCVDETTLYWDGDSCETSESIRHVHYHSNLKLYY